MGQDESYGRQTSNARRIWGVKVCTVLLMGLYVMIIDFSPAVSTFSSISNLNKIKTTLIYTIISVIVMKL